MYLDISNAQGQQQARERWGTQVSGAAFDRKKRPFLTPEARDFISQQSMCVVVGPGSRREPCGLLLVGQPGFVETPDQATCLLPLPLLYDNSSFSQGLRHTVAQGVKPQLALCFLQHATRQRICVQGEAELWPGRSSDELCVRMQVNQAFFHCPKYIRTRVPGLHLPNEHARTQMITQPHDRLNVEEQAFLERQVLCYLCTMDRHGQYAVNHRGGAAGFLVALPSDHLTPCGMVLLPDYAGNGAFEALGNILETEQAALFVPGYAEQQALCVSGAASILESDQLPTFLRERCRGAQRIIALLVQHTEWQQGDWSEALAYERTRTLVSGDAAPGCLIS